MESDAPLVLKDNETLLPLPGFPATYMVLERDVVSAALPAISRRIVDMANEVRRSGAALDGCNDKTPWRVASEKRGRHLDALNGYLDYRERIGAMGIKVEANGL